MYFPPDSALTSPSTLSGWTATWKHFKLYKTLWGTTSRSRRTAGQKHMGHRRGDKVMDCVDHLHQGMGGRRRVQPGVVRKSREEVGSLLPNKWMTLEKRVMLRTGGGMRKILVKLLVSKDWGTSQSPFSLTHTQTLLWGPRKLYQQHDLEVLEPLNFSGNVLGSYHVLTHFISHLSSTDGTSLALFYRWVNWGTGRFWDFPKISVLTALQ